jgi:uncharacterized protein
MRVVLDTNILISALISHSGPPNRIYDAWRGKRLALLTCAEQMIEVREVTRRIAVAVRIKPSEAGRLVNDLYTLTVMVGDLPTVLRSPDPKDNYLLGLAEAGQASWLVTGDKSGLLELKRHQSTGIVSARSFVNRQLRK